MEILMRKLWVLFYIGLVYGIGIVQSAVSDEALTQILQGGVTARTYPGAVAVVGNSDGILYQQAVGHFTYSYDSPHVQIDSMFDIASLTKVVSTTTAVALLYQQGYLGLDTLVVDILGTNFSSHGKDKISVRNCLLHNAGFAPDPVPWYWSPDFPCPNTDDVSPAEDFSCLEPFIHTSLYNESLQSSPGESYVYSDLSFITLQMVVGTLVRKYKLVGTGDYRNECTDWFYSHHHTHSTVLDNVCAFEAYVRLHVFGHLVSTSTASEWMPSTTYLPDAAEWDRCMPTLNDTGDASYTHKRLQGQVADGDCYAMGGVAGHAGVFSTGPDIGQFLQSMLSASLQHLYGIRSGDEGMRSEMKSVEDFLNASTVALFTTIYNVSQSSRALGWSTNTPQVSDYGYDNSCGTMSEKTYMHTGYTGTCCCVDPSRDTPMWTVILTNRIYNCDGQLCPSGSSDAVKAIYKEFNTKAREIYYPSVY